MTEFLPERYKCFDDLPYWLKAKILQMGQNPHQLEEFAHAKRERLGHRSVIEVLNEEGDEGPQIILGQLSRLIF